MCKDGKPKRYTCDICKTVKCRCKGLVESDSGVTICLECFGKIHRQGSAERIETPSNE